MSQAANPPPYRAGQGDRPPPPQQAQALIGHILTHYHQAHRLQLPALLRLAGKVETVHAAHAQVPRGLTALLHVMRTELQEHMDKEEAILFPMLMRGGNPLVVQPIDRMRAEHDEHATRITQLLALTQDATPPPDACATWQQLCAEIRSFVADLRQHIALENERLFPLFVPVGH